MPKTTARATKVQSKATVKLKIKDGSFTRQKGTDGSESKVTTFIFRFFALARRKRYSGLGGSANKSNPEIKFNLPTIFKIKCTVCQLLVYRYIL